MIAPSKEARPIEERKYSRQGSAVFLRTKERFGELSNMAGGFPIVVSGVRISTVEAIYQACRFPHMPEVQKSIIEQPSPMTAKMKGKPYRSQSREDWMGVRLKIMRWALRMKLAYNYSSFRDALLETDNLPIVEESRKDRFWGAEPVDAENLIGLNVLGRLLMELREELKVNAPEFHKIVHPPKIDNFLLYGRPIEVAITHSSLQEGRAQQSLNIAHR